MKTSSDATHLAVVVPTLNEEGAIATCLDAIGEAPSVSVVVTDGGSTDGTLAVVAKHFPDTQIVSGPPGRGAQLDRGARAVPADSYVFVHADCRLPGGWVDAVRNTLAEPGVVLGCFRLRTEPPPGGNTSLVARTWWRLLDLRARGISRPYGDQALFLNRAVLETVGGVPRIALMEDVELVRRCLQLGRLARVPLEVRTTARRFAGAPLRTRLCTATFPSLYRLGVSPDRLARWYGKGR